MVKLGLQCVVISHFLLLFFIFLIFALVINMVNKTRSPLFTDFCTHDSQTFNSPRVLSHQYPPFSPPQNKSKNVKKLPLPPCSREFIFLYFTAHSISMTAFASHGTAYPLTVLRSGRAHTSVYILAAWRPYRGPGHTAAGGSFPHPAPYH